MNVEKTRAKILKYKKMKESIISSNRPIGSINLDLNISFLEIQKKINLSVQPPNIKPLIRPVLREALKVRRMINGHDLTVINDKSKKTNKPVIYAMTHIGNYDYEMVVQTLKKGFYTLAGDWDLSYGTIDDYFFRANGVVYVDNEDKKDCNNTLKMLIKLLKEGESVLWCPEGTWNLDSHLPVLNIYPGIIKAAKIANVDIIPIAVEQREKNFYINIGENIDAKKLSGDGCKDLRDIMATLKWEIWESLPITKREDLDENYFKKFVEERLAECSYIPKSVFKHRVYRDKNVVTEEDVFSFLYKADYEKAKQDSNHCFKWLTKEEESALTPEEYERYYYEMRELYDKSAVNKLSLEQRKMIHPILLNGLKIMNRLRGYQLKIIGDEREKTERPIIYAITHICKEDIELSAEIINNHFYLLCGDFESLHNTLDGIFLGLNGVIYFNEKNKQERKEVKQRMKEALKSGINIMYFPEGTWNLSPNLLVNPFYNGIIEVAKDTNAIIIPIAIEQYENQFIAKVGQNFDVQSYQLESYKLDAIKDLRNIMATLKFDIISSVPMLKRDGINPEDYYKQFIDSRIGQWPTLTLEDFTKAVFKDKSIVTEKEAFAPILKLHTKKENK